MRINPTTNGLDPRAVSDATVAQPLDGKTFLQGPQQPQQPAPAEQGLVVERQHAAYIQQAAASDELNLGAVEDARKMLESGELDTPEAANRLADSILKFGL